MITPAERPAFWVAYNALEPYTQHAHVREDLAERIVTALRDHEPLTAAEQLIANWPNSYTRINREALTEVVIAAWKARDGQAATNPSKETDQ